MATSVELIDWVRNAPLKGVTGGYDFVDVRDVAEGIIAAAKKGRKGECYILSNQFISIHKLLNYLKIATGGIKKVCFPLGLVKALAPIFEWYGKITRTRLQENWVMYQEI